MTAATEAIVGDAVTGAATPLAGLRILAIEHMLAMPYATKLLALLGADVVRVEPVTGEGGRASLPSITTDDGTTLGATFMRGNVSKRSIAIDLKQPAGRELVLRMLPRFDVVAENMRPGVMDSLGLGYEDLRAAKADVILVSLSGFGNGGGSPYRSWPAYAPIVDAIAGWYELDRPDGEVPRVGSLGALGDVAAGIFAALGTLAAYVRRQRTGLGDHVDVAMADTSLALNDAAPLMWSMGKTSQSHGVGIVTAFRADDGYFAVTVIRPHMFARFAEVLDVPEWTTDPRLATRAQWSERLDDLIRPVVERWAKGRTKLEAAGLLAGAGVAAAPSNDSESIVRDPHFTGRHVLIDTGETGHDGRPLIVTGVPLQFHSAELPAPGPWPAVGEHSVEVLRQELELDDADIAALLDDGVIARPQQ